MNSYTAHNGCCQVCREHHEQCHSVISDLAIMVNTLGGKFTMLLWILSGIGAILGGLLIGILTQEWARIHG